MDPMLTEEHIAIREAAHKYFSAKIAPHALAVDRGERSTFDHWPGLAEQGYLAPSAPAEYGGLGADPITQALVATELAAACPSTALSLFASVVLCGNTILDNGTEEQKKRYAAPLYLGEKIGCWGLTEPHAGSDVAATKSTAKRQNGHWVLNGSKTFITNAPKADIFVIYARTGQGHGHSSMSTFILEKGMRGLEVGPPMRKMGFRGSPTGEIFMDDVSVPEENMLGPESMGFWQAMNTLTEERSTAPFMALGMMQRCLDLSIKYARQRETFGKPISHKQGIQFKLAHMYTLIEHVRAMAWSLLMLKMQGKEHIMQASAAKDFAGEACLDVAMEAVQIHGGYGYMEEYEVERYARDAKLLQIGAGTSEIQKIIIARMLLKE